VRKLLAIFRGSLHTIVYAVVVLAILFYLAVHFNLTGLVVKKALTEQLSEQINSRITVDGDAEVNWLNQVVLNDLTIYDQKDDTLIHARRAMVAFDLLPLLSNHLVLNTCQLIDFDIRTYRVSPDSAANYQFLIDAFKRDDDPDRKPFIQQLDLNAILLRQGKLSYDVLDQPRLTDIPVDPNHVAIDKLSANVHVHDTHLLIKKFHCDEHESSIKADRCELSLNVKEVLEAPEGENKFLLKLKGFEMTNPHMTVQADAQGTSDELELDLKEFELPYGHPRIKGVHELFTSAKLRVSQLKNPIDSLYLTADIRDLKLRVDTLGNVHMNGTIQGMPCHAQLDGSLATDIGNAVLDANFEAIQRDTTQTSYKNRHFIVQGHCKTDGFELDKILPEKAELGHTVFDLDYKLVHKPKQPTRLTLIGKFGEIVWKEHAFNNVKVNGEIQERKFKGDIALNDSLGDVNSKFNVDFSKPDRHLRMDGTIAHFNPNGLKLSDNKHLDSLTITAKIHADVIASNWHDAEGDMKISNLFLEKGERRLDLDDIVFEGTSEKGELNSSIAHVTYDRNRRTHEYHIKGEIPVINDLFAILDFPIAMNREALFEARIDSANHFKDAHAELPALDLHNGRAIAATLDIESDQDGMLSPTLDFEALTQQHRLVGTLQGRVIPEPLDITLEPTQLLFNRDVLQLSEAHLAKTEEGDYILENFKLTGSSQEIAASGTLGQSGDKSFIISLKQFDLDQVLGSFEKNYMHFGGRATGDIVINSEPELHIKADSLYVQNFSYIDTLLGNGYLNAEVQVPKKFITISADIVTDSIYKSHADFDFQLAKHDTIDLRVYPDHLPLGFINNWTGSILQKFSGRITGPVRLYGDMDHMQLEGHPYLDGRFTHDLIGAHFHIADTVHLEPGVIHVENGYVDDCHGHPLTLNTRIDHEYLHNFLYDVNVDMPHANQGFLALDREKAPGRIYWGQIYVEGQAQLKGGNGKHRVNINVGTTDKSWVYLSPYEQDIDTNQDAYSFLTFRDKKLLEQMADEMAQEGTTLQIPTQVKNAEEEMTDLQVDLQVNGTEQCQVTFQMDPLSEDLLKGVGRGNLSIRYDPRRDITLAGTYRISDGTYAMKVKGDIMNKEFRLQNTSFVRFNGVPSEAELSLDCLYNIPSVNLSDLDENILSLSSLSRATVPVDLTMSITGQLATPIIKFGLEVKNVSDEINAYVQNIIATEQMLNQEVIYLLLFSKFYTPQYAQSTQSRTGSELTSFASASLTSQLNQLLGQMSNNVTMGTNFRTDKGDFSDMEMDITVSTRLLGDRLLLNGNVGYRDPANRIGTGNNTNSFIGDFDIEFLINNRGTVRAKAYSHYNERDYSINNALTTQGIGFILRKDFSNLYDLWPWNKWRKENEGIIEKNDSISQKQDPALE
jgi:hypothetical protein